MPACTYDNIQQRLKQLSVGSPNQQNSQEVDQALLALAKVGTGNGVAASQMTEAQRDDFKAACAGYADEVLHVENGASGIDDLTQEQATQLRVQALFAYVHRKILSLDFKNHAVLLNRFFNIKDSTNFFEFLQVHKGTLGLDDLDFSDGHTSRNAFTVTDFGDLQEAAHKSTAFSVITKALRSAEATTDRVASLQKIGVTRDRSEQIDALYDLKCMLLGNTAVSSSADLLSDLNLDVLNQIGLDQIKSKAATYTAYRYLQSITDQEQGLSKLRAVLSSSDGSSLITALKDHASANIQTALGTQPLNPQQIKIIKQCAFDKYLQFQLSKIDVQALTQDQEVASTERQQQITTIMALYQYIHGMHPDNDGINQNLEALQRFRFSTANIPEVQHQALFGSDFYMADLTSHQHQQLFQAYADKLRDVEASIHAQGSFDLDPCVSDHLQISDAVWQAALSEQQRQLKSSEASATFADASAILPDDASLSCMRDFVNQQTRLAISAFNAGNIPEAATLITKVAAVNDQLGKSLPTVASRPGFTPATHAPLKKLHDEVQARLVFAKLAQQLFRLPMDADKEAVQLAYQELREAYKKLFVSTPVSAAHQDAADTVAAEITAVFSHKTEDYAKALACAKTHHLFEAQSEKPQKDSNGVTTVSRLVGSELSGTELIHRCNNDGSTSLTAKGTQAHVIKALVLAFKADLIAQGKLGADGKPLNNFTFKLHPSQINIKSGAVNEMGRTDRAAFLQQLDQAFHSELQLAYQGGLATPAAQSGFFAATANMPSVAGDASVPTATAGTNPADASSPHKP